MKLSLQAWTVLMIIIMAATLATIQSCMRQVHLASDSCDWNPLCPACQDRQAQEANAQKDRTLEALEKWRGSEEGGQ